jgi:sec-independent protein translocase protein TatA
MGEFSIWHILIVGVLAMLFFGPSKLPQLGKSMGEAIRGFKKGLNEDEPPAPQVRREQVRAPESDTTQTTATRDKTREPSDT